MSKDLVLLVQTLVSQAWLPIHAVSNLHLTRCLLKTVPPGTSANQLCSFGVRDNEARSWREHRESLISDSWTAGGVDSSGSDVRGSPIIKPYE